MKLNVILKVLSVCEFVYIGFIFNRVNKIQLKQNSCIMIKSQIYFVFIVLLTVYFIKNVINLVNYSEFVETAIQLSIEWLWGLYLFFIIKYFSKIRNKDNSKINYVVILLYFFAVIVLHMFYYSVAYILILSSSILLALLVHYLIIDNLKILSIMKRYQITNNKQVPSKSSFVIYLVLNYFIVMTHSIAVVLLLRH